MPRKKRAGKAKVKSEAGRDVTENFLKGAKQTAAAAKMLGIRFAVLKERSPSCGVSETTVDSEARPGCGVTAAVLRASGVEVFGVS